MISDEELLQAQRNLHLFSPEQKARVLELLEEREKQRDLRAARENMIPFVKKVWPEFIHGAHHTLMAEAFEDAIAGGTKRLAISIGPRHGKSELSSLMLPAWYLGKYPDRKVIQVSNGERLAAGFGRRVRNMIAEDPTYHEIFPDTILAKDSQAAADWHTSRNGRYFAVGVNGVVTGEGANLAILDDIHSEQEAKNAEHNPAIFDDAVEWFTSGIRQRLQPGGIIIIVMTRWSKRDLIGQVLRKMDDAILAGKRKGTYDEWKVIEFPAILDEDTPEQRPLWPAFWKLDELLATKEAIGPVKWAAQYRQQPTGTTNALFKPTIWKRWGADPKGPPDPTYNAAWENSAPPACSFIVHSWDTAIKKNERADYSAFTSWGVFPIQMPNVDDEDEEAMDGPRPFRPRKYKTVNNLILLSAYKARLEFPELKRKVKQFYTEDSPDTLLIEDKGSGSSLIQELRSMGVPVENFSFGRGSKGVSNDKIARANLVTDLFASGFIWAPMNRFAEEVIAEMADFPAGVHDDYVDSTVQALIRFREGGFVRTANDEDEDDTPVRSRRKRYY